MELKQSQHATERVTIILTYTNGYHSFIELKSFKLHELCVNNFKITFILFRSAFISFVLVFVVVDLAESTVRFPLCGVLVLLTGTVCIRLR